jgi:NAD+ kinase
MTSRRIIIVGNMAKAGVAECIEQMQPWLAERAEILSVCNLSESIGEEVNRAELCVVVGGDGTLLAAGRALAGHDVPLVGVNMGKLGFLAEFSVDDVKKHFAAIGAGQIQATRRMMLTASLTGPEGEFTTPVANDVAISAGRPFRMIDLNLCQGFSTIAQYFGDGLVIATPTGSTGYNMSAGGPILQPTMNAVVVTPVAPHALSLRPLVLTLAEPISITASRVNAGTSVIVDGQIPLPLQTDGQLVISAAEHPMRIIPNPDRTYFQVLASKLHWGLSPHHLGNES